MNNIVGLAVLGLGIVLLIFGFKESHSASSDVSRFFTGDPTDRSMWLLVGGTVTVIVVVSAFARFALWWSKRYTRYVPDVPIVVTPVSGIHCSRLFSQWLK